ncbi:hypothetical protein CR513_22147, partial [Mucuna pruriens]
MFLLCMTRSSSSNLHAYDFEIDRTLYGLINSSSNEVINNNSLNCSVSASNPANNVDFNFDLGSSNTGSDFNFGVSISQVGLDNMENNDRTLKELATPNFHGLVGEDPHKRLKEFHVVCSTMRPHGVPKDYIKMKAFSFSLDAATKDHLYL